LADVKHRKAVERAISELPKLEIVLRFCDYYQITRPFEGPSKTLPTILPLPLRDRIPRKDPEKGEAAQTVPASPPATNGFHIPTSVTTALAKAPRLGGDPRLNSVRFWQAEIRANNGIDFAAEILKAEAWMVAYPKKAPKSDLPGFLHRWLTKTKARLTEDW
jgi:hypothetical protein